jgi:hypothetical protein
MAVEGASTEGPTGERQDAVIFRVNWRAQEDTDGAPFRQQRTERNHMTQQVTTSTEKIDVKGGHLVEKVKELVHEGNVRRIIIKDSDGKAVIEVPVTVGVVGFLIAPTIAAVAALAAVAADYSIEVERESPESTDTGASPPA